MQKNKFLGAFLTVLLAAALFAPSAAADGPDAPVLAESVILIERDTGAVLHEVNADEPREPDSMVKTMTLLLAAEAIENGYASKSEVVTAQDSAFSDAALSGDSSSLMPGEAMTLIDLMYCAYIGSHDEACNIIAEHLAGSVSEFVAQMNERAAELGCTGTVFTNTYGGRDPRQYTTARDLARITAAASRSYVFTEVAGAVTYTASATNVHSARSFTNVNHMQNEARALYYYKYAVFGKVSAAYDIGYCSIEFAERGDMALIAVLLKAQAVVTDDGTTMQNITESKRLLEWGFSAYSWKTAFSTAQPVTKVPVMHGDGAEYVNLRPERELRALLRNSDDEEQEENDGLTWEITVFAERDGERLTAPIEAGEPLGELILMQNGRELGRVALVADTSVSLRRMSLLRQSMTSAVKSVWFRVIVIIAVILFVAYTVIVIRYNIIRAKRAKILNARREELARQRREQDYDENEWR